MSGFDKIKRTLKEIKVDDKSKVIFEDYVPHFVPYTKCYDLDDFEPFCKTQLEFLLLSLGKLKKGTYHFTLDTLNHYTNYNCYLLITTKKYKITQEFFT